MPTESLKDYLNRVLHSMDFEMIRFEYLIEEDNAKEWNEVHTQYLEARQTIQSFDRLSSHREIGLLVRILAPMLIREVLNKAEEVAVGDPALEQLNRIVGSRLKWATQDFESMLDTEFEKLSARIDRAQLNNSKRISELRESLVARMENSDNNQASAEIGFRSQVDVVQKTVNDFKLEISSELASLDADLAKTKLATSEDMVNLYNEVRTMRQELAAFSSSVSLRSHEDSNVLSLVGVVDMLRQELDQTKMVVESLQNQDQLAIRLNSLKMEQNEDHLLVQSLKEELAEQQRKTKAIEKSVDELSNTIKQVAQVVNSL